MHENIKEDATSKKGEIRRKRKQRSSFVSSFISVKKLLSSLQRKEKNRAKMRSVCDQTSKHEMAILSRISSSLLTFLLSFSAVPFTDFYPKKHEYIWKESETRLEKETHRETEKLKKLHRLQKLVKNKFKICHHHFSLLFVREMNLPEKKRERINREELAFLD